MGPWQRGPVDQAKLGGLLRCRIDHFIHFGDLGGWKTADLRVLADNALVLCQIDAKSLVGRHIAFDPLNVGPKLAQHLVRLRRRTAQLLALQAADGRNIAFNNEFAQCHDVLQMCLYDLGTAYAGTSTETIPSGPPCKSRRTAGPFAGVRSAG